MRYWYCIDNNGNKWLYEGSVAPVKYDDAGKHTGENKEVNACLVELGL